MCPFLSPLHTVTQEGLWLWTPAVTSAVWMECRSPCPRRSHRVSEFMRIFAFSAICASLWCIATYWWPIKMSDETIAVFFRNYLQTFFCNPALISSFLHCVWQMPNLSLLSRALETCLVSTVSMCAHHRQLFKVFFCVVPCLNLPANIVRKSNKVI